jgi:hypothetical protein
MDRKRNVIGYTEIPDLRKHGGDGFCKGVVEQLVPGKALVLEYEFHSDLEKDRRNIINAATRKFGSRKLLTATEGNKLYLWLNEGIETSLQTTDGKPVVGTFIQNARW